MKTPPVQFEPAPSTRWPTLRRGRRQNEQVSSIGFAIRLSGHHLHPRYQAPLGNALLRSSASCLGDCPAGTLTRSRASQPCVTKQSLVTSVKGGPPTVQLPPTSPRSCRRRGRPPFGFRRLV